MWNNKYRMGYRSLFLLVRVRSGRFRLALPLALFVINETLEIIAGMLWLVEKFAPIKAGRDYSCCGPERHGPKIKRFMTKGFSANTILKLCRELLNELRRHGRYSLVEVETGDGSHKQRVSLELF